MSASEALLAFETAGLSGKDEFAEPAEDGFVVPTLIGRAVIERAVLAEFRKVEPTEKVEKAGLGGG